MKIFILSAGKCSVVTLSAGVLQRVNPGMKRRQHSWSSQGICGDAGPHGTIPSHHGAVHHSPAERHDPRHRPKSAGRIAACTQLPKQTSSHTLTQSHTHSQMYAHSHTCRIYKDILNTDTLTYILRHIEKHNC